jgi:hypothetical protein
LFAIVHSTTIALLAWCKTCANLNLKVCLIPRDVVTWWNSTYDMMSFVLKYQAAIDSITADKGLKLRRYRLDDKDWKIVSNLVSILEIWTDAFTLFTQSSLTFDTAIQEGYCFIFI